MCIRAVTGITSIFPAAGKPQQSRNAGWHPARGRCSGGFPNWSAGTRICSALPTLSSACVRTLEVKCGPPRLTEDAEAETLGGLFRNKWKNLKLSIQTRSAHICFGQPQNVSKESFSIARNLQPGAIRTGTEGLNLPRQRPVGLRPSPSVRQPPLSCTPGPGREGALGQRRLRPLRTLTQLPRARRLPRTHALPPSPTQSPVGAGSTQTPLHLSIPAQTRRTKNRFWYFKQREFDAGNSLHR